MGLWDLNSQPEIEPGPTAVKVPISNHFTAREFPRLVLNRVILPSKDICNAGDIFGCHSGKGF